MTDWSALGYPADPIPGDADAVLAHATHYSDIARTIAETAASLRRSVDAADAESVAVAEFSELALRVSISVDEVDERYAFVSEALATYASALGMVRSAAAAQADLAAAALAQAEAATRRIEHYEHQISDPTTPPANSAYLESRIVAVSQDRLHADHTVAVAMHRVAELIAQRAAAADDAARSIEAFVEASALNDTAWDRVAAFAEDVHEWVLSAVESLMEVLDAVLPVIDMLATLLTIIAIILVLTGVGGAVAAALFAIARVLVIVSIALKAITLLFDVVLAANGRRSVSQVAVRGLDLGVSIATLGRGGEPTKAAALVDYLVVRRSADAIVDRVQYVADAIDGDSELTLGQVLYDAALTSAEQDLLVAASDPSLTLGAEADAVLLLGDTASGAVHGAALVAASPIAAGGAVVPGVAGEALSTAADAVLGAGAAIAKVPMVAASVVASPIEGMADMVSVVREDVLDVASIEMHISAPWTTLRVVDVVDVVDVVGAEVTA